MMTRTFQLRQWLRLFLVMAAITLGISSLAHAGAGFGTSTDITGAPKVVPTYYANSPAGLWTDWQGNQHDSGTAIRKFVDSLPGVPGVTSYGAANNLGQYMPLAVSTPYNELDGTTSDYYEIGVVEYTEKLHSDLPKATTLRGYVQLVPCGGTAVPLTIANGLTTNVTGVTTPLCGADKPHYLGPLIIATRNKATRIKYTNLLPIGHFNPATNFRGGDLFIPVDKTLMGAGLGPNLGTETYTENRTAVHLHGGDNPWISDGTPHQWLTPAGETTSYPTGASLASVPDMPAPGAGSGNLYYPNGDGARLMFYHEHAAGITRLNVFAGVAAGYLLTEPAAEGLLPATPGGQIPLVIQEKTFVPKDIAVQDAKWNKDSRVANVTPWGTYGDIWYPHVYETNQDPNSFDGTNPVGRWDYGPWFWPVFPVADFLPSGDYYGCTTFNGVSYCGYQASTTPEAFSDTPMVNGTAYPSLTVQPQAYRLRILNAMNDRSINLGLYMADPTVVTADGRTNTEVKMVPFTGPNTITSSYACPASGMTEVSASYPVSFPCAGGLQGTGWGQQDNRPGGVPDPTTAGPNIWQIGSEGGFLPQVADIPSTPINFEYNKRSVTVLNVLEHGLFLMPAERADAVIDFSQFPGKTLILYNDAPTPVPAGDPRVDYYTGNPDQTAVGGAPSTLAGYGPNTRTIMQIQVGAGNQPIQSVSVVKGGSGYPLNPIVTISGGGATVQATATATVSSGVGSVTVTNGGTGYSAPVVTFLGGGGMGAAATATIGSGVTALNLTSPGTGYTAPTVSINGGGGAGAAATATTDLGTITSIAVTAPGTGYVTPVVTITDTGAGAGATATAAIDGTGAITGITVTNPGTGYTAPAIAITDSTGPGAGATASATVGAGAITLTLTNGGSGYSTAPTVAITDPSISATGAVASATIGTLSVTGITVTNSGIGYTSAPTVIITDATGTGAAATANVSAGMITAINLVTPGAGYTSAPTITIAGGTGAIAVANFAPLPAFNKAALDSALPQAYAVSQPLPIVAESAYGLPTGPFPQTFPDQYARIYTGASLQPNVVWTDGTGIDRCYSVDGSACTTKNGVAIPPIPASGLIFNKAIQELFDSHGRMNATLGVELPFTSALTQTTIPLGYIDPATETVKDGETQIWKITHNGVDSHPVHFHLINVQVINRVGWDGTIKPPYDNELGWKETVRMNPLEDIIVAVRAKSPKLPFSIGNSNRYLDPTQPPNVTTGFTQINPNTGNPAVVTNVMANFGWEYVWHCHILGHEENDFMRPFVLTGATNYNTADHVAPTITTTVTPAPNAAGWNKANATVGITATDNAAPIGSGVANITYDALGGIQVIPTTTVKAPNNLTYTLTTNVVPVISTEGTTTVNISATDNAFVPNTGTATVLVKLDKTPPTITGTRAPLANAFGWNNTNVTVTFTATDAISGVATVTAPVTLTANGANLSATGTATDNAGNSANVTVNTIRIDKTAPIVAVANFNRNNNPGGVTANVTVTGTVTDQAGLSGVDTTANAGTFTATAAGQPMVTGTFTVAANGAYSFIANNLARKLTWTFVVTAKDRAGNIGTVTRAFALN